MASRQQFPRGSGGCVLYPGTLVQLHSLRVGNVLNGQEATCEQWDADVGRMHVRLSCGALKAMKPANLRKVRTQDETKETPEVSRVLEVFQKYDVNGDGVIDNDEFAACLKSLGLSRSCLSAFLRSADKDGDTEIQYEEFCRWALSSGEKSEKSRLDVYWPQGKSQSAHNLGEDEEEISEERELTVEDIEKICGELPEGWPKHGVDIVNNMRARFPGYPVEGIVWRARRNNFIGGKVIAAIRATGAKEVETVPPSAVKVGRPGAFPALYWVTRDGDKPMLVYAQAGKNWSFQNMRDGKLNHVGSIPSQAKFKVLEVRRGNEYGFCYGRIDFQGRTDHSYWVVLGLEVSNLHWTRGDLDRTGRDLNYSDAVRVK